ARSFSASTTSSTPTRRSSPTRARSRRIGRRTGCASPSAGGSHEAAVTICDRGRPLHADFGVEIAGVDLRRVTASEGYSEIRAAFEEPSLLLFRDQLLDDEAPLALGALFGPIEDRSMGANGPEPQMANVTNRLDDGTISAPESLHTLNLVANQLWHTDSTFLPVPA